VYTWWVCVCYFLL